MAALRNLFAPAPHIERLPAGRVGPAYRRMRIQVFAGIFLGYAAFYLVRKNLALAIPDILAEYPHYTKAMLGTAMTGLSIAYGVSKFVMGSVSDRSNPRWFMPAGLFMSCAIMLFVGTQRWVYDSMLLLVALMTLNGWVQGMGWPPCGKTMVHWYSTNERGMAVSLWNVAHNVGGGLVAWLAVVGVGMFNDWGAKFYFNGLIAAVIAVLVVILLRDTPQSCGLPPIEEHRNDFPPGYHAAHEKEFTFGEIVFGSVLNNKYLWAIAIANAFAYFVRYGVVDWIPTYLQNVKGYTFEESSLAWTLYEFAAIPGTIACGLLSDRVFKGRRAPATILFMALTMIFVIVYWLNLDGPKWIDYTALVAIGFLIYGPIMIIGLHALDLVPKKAAGTAAGFTGFFGYVFGSAIAGTGVGWLADNFGWRGVFATMVVCCLLTIAFAALTLGHRAESGTRGTAEPEA